MASKDPQLPVQHTAAPDTSFFPYRLVVAFSLPAATLVNFLFYHGYSLFHPEVLIIFSAVTLFALAVAGLGARWSFVGALLTAFIVACYLDFILSVESIKFRLSLGATTFCLLATALLFLALRPLGRQTWRGLAAAALFILLGSVTTRWTAPPIPLIKEAKEEDLPAERRTDLPLFLYVILDEHMGIRWMPDDIPAAKTARRDMLNFYKKFGFLLHDNAFSHYVTTDQSVSNVVNFSTSREKREFYSNWKKKRLNRNAMFDLLAKKGYRIRAYQSNYINVCPKDGKGIEFALEYQNNNIGVLQSIEIPVVDKALLILGHFFRSSSSSFVSKQVGKARRFDPPGGLRIPLLSAPYNRLGPLNVAPTLTRLRADVSRFPRGTAFFAHLLTPHFPYVYAEDGRVKTDPRTWYGPANWFGTATEPTRAERYQEYYRQVSALYGTLDQWLSEMKRDGLLDDAVIVFHGDHGSRITEAKPDVSAVSRPDWGMEAKDSFSTIFAVKSPDFSPGIVETAKSINALASDFFLAPARFKEPRPGDSFVLLRDKRKPREALTPYAVDFDH